MNTNNPLLLAFTPLSPAALEALREAYSAEALIALGELFLTEPYPAAGPWASFVMGRLYAGGELSGLQRELVLLSLLATTKQPGTLAVHLYWALMEGATPEMVADALVLAGTYAGIDTYTVGIRTLHKVSALLEGLVQDGRVDSVSVMQEVVKLFPA